MASWTFYPERCVSANKPRITLILTALMALSLGLVVSLDAASSPPKVIRTLRGHNSIEALAFSPDGKLIATGGDDDTIRLWEAGTGKELRALKRPSIPAPLAFSNDSQLLASGEIGAVLLDVRTGAEKLRLPNGMVDALQFSPDGKTLATGQFEGFLKLWEIPSGRLRLRIKDIRHPSRVNSRDRPPPVSTLAFSPDGRMIATGNAAENSFGVKLWDVSTGALRKTLGVNKHTVSTLAFSPDGKLIAGWGASGGQLNRQAWVTIWEVTSGREIAQLEEEGAPKVLVFSPNGRLLAIPGSMDSGFVLRLWDVRTKNYIHSIPVDGSLGPVAFSPDGKSLAAAVSYVGVVIWDMTPFRIGR